MGKFTQKQKWSVVGLSILGAGLTAGTICGIVYGTQIANQHHEYFKIDKNININVEKNGDTYDSVGEIKLGTWNGPSFNNEDDHLSTAISCFSSKFILYCNNGENVKKGFEFIASQEGLQGLESIDTVKIQFVCLFINDENNKVLAMSRPTANLIFHVVEA